MQDSYIVAGIFIASLMTYLTRVLPFVFFRKKEPSSLVRYIERNMPVMIMVVLVFYALKDVKSIAALDRSAPGGAAGMLFNEIAGALFNTDSKALLSGYIYGLGGRDLLKSDIANLYKELQANVEAGKLLTQQQQFIGVRGPKLSFL